MGVLFAAIVATIISFAFGALWYGPFFGNEWRRLQKIKEKESKPSTKPMIIGFFRHFITAIVIAYILTGVDMRSGLITVGLWWLAFTAMPLLSDVIWVKRPLKLYAINVAYELFSVIIMTIVVTTWFSVA